jgi:ATP-dependent Clp protease ATP-binding subunit ClpB
MREIVDIQLVGLRDRLAQRGVRLELTDNAKDYLAGIGYDPAYGARPLKRAIGRQLETPIAKLILGGELHDNSSLSVDFKDGRFSFGEKLAN